MMSSSYNYAVGSWAFGPVPDRYLATGYHEKLDFECYLESALKVDGCRAVELPYAKNFITSETCKGIYTQTQDMGLKISSLGVNITGDRKWAQGSLTNPNKKIRWEAINTVQECMQTAKDVGADVVNLWMGQDGFDYPFEADYTLLFRHLVEGLKECAESCSDIKLSVEYKAKEPRAKSIPNSTSQTLLAVMKADCSNLGVTLDFGHALLGGENPSQSLSLLSEYGKLFHIHMNDNYGDWDWDMAAGVIHFWELVEFCYWINRTGYTGWLSLDVFPFRCNPEKLCTLSIKAIEKAKKIAESLQKENIDSILLTRDAMEIYKLFVGM